MGCSNCGSSNSVPNGCKSNGSCGTGGCGKLPVFDWLANVELPNGQSTYDIVEIRFKNSRKTFFRNIKNIPLLVGDVVVVDASPGYDMGVVSVVGELARIQVRKKTSNFKAHEARSILNKATKENIEKWQLARNKEAETMLKARQIASEVGLKMKISDVEYQADGTKAMFYYTADERVDFRQLIRELAEIFKVKIEMKQIGVRQEAARLGGIGSCGRELCCSTWLTDFRSVSTASARYQQLSLNPEKLAGQCGKLKCCLNFELDTYVDALKAFPRTDIKLNTAKGKAFHIKTDVFKKQMWYLYENGTEGAGSGFIPIKPDKVREIIKMNKDGKKPHDLKDFMEAVEVKVPDYTNVVGQDSLNRFEHVFKRKKKKTSSTKTKQPVNVKNKQSKEVKNTTIGGDDVPQKSKNKNVKVNTKKPIDNDKANRNNPNFKGSKSKAKPVAKDKKQNSRTKPKEGQQGNKKPKTQLTAKQIANNEKANRNNPNQKKKVQKKPNNKEDQPKTKKPNKQKQKLKSDDKKE
jgi:cell fate regulator YaaT (PSP1 superfamily)